jgi:hypothetical protein
MYKYIHTPTHKHKGGGPGSGVLALLEEVERLQAADKMFSEAGIPEGLDDEYSDMDTHMPRDLTE